MKKGHLTTEARKRMPSSDFALPGHGEGKSGKGAGTGTDGAWGALPAGTTVSLVLRRPGAFLQWPLTGGDGAPTRGIGLAWRAASARATEFRLLGAALARSMG